MRAGPCRASVLERPAAPGLNRRGTVSNDARVRFVEAVQMPAEVYAELLADAIARSRPRAALLAPRRFDGVPAIARVLAGSWRGRSRDTIRSSGYVVHTLEAAIWSVARTADFSAAVLLAANLADDADTVAAVTGQLAGALYGLTGIPRPGVIGSSGRIDS